MSNTTGHGGSDVGMTKLDQFSDEEIMRRMRAVMGEPMNPLTVEPSKKRSKFVDGAVVPKKLATALPSEGFQQ